jgi:hypothetical protein
MISFCRLPSLSVRMVSKTRRTRTMSMFVFSVLTLVMMLSVAPESCKAGPITDIYFDGPNAFSFTVTGGSFNVDDMHRLVRTQGNWILTATIDENAGAIDVLSINGTGRTARRRSEFFCL